MKDWLIGLDIIEWLTLLFVLQNLVTFCLYVADKRRAVKGKWRISERTLILFTLAFGGFGALFGMYIARHKTKRLRFRLVLVLGLVVAVVFAAHLAQVLALPKMIMLELPK